MAEVHGMMDGDITASKTSFNLRLLFTGFVSRRSKWMFLLGCAEAQAFQRLRSRWQRMHMNEILQAAGRPLLKRELKAGGNDRGLRT